MKLLLKVLGIVCAIFIVLTLLISVNILIGWNGLKPVRSDCIIVLGCKVDKTVPSPFLKSRVDEGIRLYKAGYGKYIIVSGGQGQGEDITEAEAMKKIMVSKGIDQKVILIENKSTSTLTNLINSKKIMDAMNFRNAVIVSNKFHLKRASMIAKEVGVKASYSGVYNSKYKLQEFSSFLREVLATYKFYLFNE